MKRNLLLYLFAFLIFFPENLRSENKENIYEKIDILSEVLNKINKEYVDNVNQSKL